MSYRKRTNKDAHNVFGIIYKKKRSIGGYAPPTHHTRMVKEFRLATIAEGYSTPTASGIATSIFSEPTASGIATSNFSEPTASGIAATSNFSEPTASGIAKDYSTPTASGIATSNFSEPTASGIATSIFSDPTASGIATSIFSEPTASGTSTSNFSEPTASGIAALLNKQEQVFRAILEEKLREQFNIFNQLYIDTIFKDYKNTDLSYIN
jgi:hypothetical protein